MREPLKAGDRVRVYGNTQIGSFEHPSSAGAIGTVCDFHDDGWIQVRFETGSNYTVHPKQCRRLKPRRERRRRVWISPDALADTTDDILAWRSPDPIGMFIEFREVKRK